MCSCVDLITLIFISKTSDGYGLKAVNGYQKRPSETMQLIIGLSSVTPGTSGAKPAGTFGRPEDNVRDSGRECPKPIR